MVVLFSGIYLEHWVFYKKSKVATRPLVGSHVMNQDVIQLKITCLLMSSCIWVGGAWHLSIILKFYASVRYEPERETVAGTLDCKICGK